MSKISFAKASAVLVGLSMLAAASYPAFAQDSTSSAVKPTLRNQTVNKTKLQEKLETREQRIEDRINVMREKIASKAAALKVKLQTFRDQKKAEIAGRINDLLNKINQNQTAQMQKHLDRMALILSKLEARVNRGTPDIKNPATARSAIASASASIASASAAVSTQAQKDYTIAVTTENRLRLDSKAQRDRLHADLLATRKTVQDAKQAVSNAIRIAKSLSPLNTEKSEKEGTRSGE